MKIFYDPKGNYESEVPTADKSFFETKSGKTIVINRSLSKSTRSRLSDLSYSPKISTHVLIDGTIVLSWK